ncbi:protein-export chaperone SecB [Asticcacaulis sp. ZE23SCel15]|jgi:preprotein translocase subunit SecB|uniref:protein-export chaperone SecB n=1 Tax=Asticcacaulis sp. ZE23SCel15 TaxID=3059027 RepID=UPI00265E7B99|nr:protein-export chaperone SecB [Asticcacaulis sp. ZE23SCel15]WKL58303.1 protein-export chaperone SecB [Asticcacaulis sp. ZE23SCel15]
MTDTVAPEANTQNGAQTEGLTALPANMQVLAQFIRDFSFENPRAPQSLRMDVRPEVDMGVEMNAKGRPDGLFEVDLKLSVKATNPEGPVFNIELVYGGLFQLANVPQHMVEPTLLVECPRYLFPFARRIISDVTADGGFFPPFMVEPIDFAALYMSQKNAGSIGETAGQA